MIASQKAFALKVIDAVESLIVDTELGSIGPSDQFMATELHKHSLDIDKLSAWAESARAAINRSDAVVAGRLIEAGMSLMRSFSIIGV